MKAINAQLSAMLDMDSYELYTLLAFYVEYFDMDVQPENDWGKDLENLFLQFKNADELWSFSRKFCATALQRSDSDTVREMLSTIIKGAAGENECPACGGESEIDEILQHDYRFSKVIRQCLNCDETWEDIIENEHFE